MSAQGRIYPFAKPSADVRYLRIAAVYWVVIARIADDRSAGLAIACFQCRERGCLRRPRRQRRLWRRSQRQIPTRY